ncbi:hypothetical protein OTU49_005323 [Cherax quadricarinatus]|uniref:Uncharacterized protein n=1 Tax=Cherax quadricarinatus TaxID=27406 RepID=A0AAW0X831_CHEQU
MASSLGVSKSILNNVIFCHQEEANWPLDEGKKVKDRFDAIFNATKYIKCLETIRKLRLEVKAKIKNLQDILVELKKWKEEANRKRVDLKSNEDKHKNIEAEKQGLTSELEPVILRLKQISNIEGDIGRIREELSGKQHQLESLRRTQDELRATLREQFTCSDEELYNMIKDFQRDLEQKEADQSRLESQVYDLEREVEKTQDEVARAVRRQGELESAHNRQKNHIDRRNKLMTNIVEEFTITEFLGIQNFKDEQADSMLSQLLKIIKEERGNILAKKEECEKEEAKIQSEIDDLRLEKLL